ncbi:MAG TPA: DNA-3-methyladenine glycosylase [Edaphocola sp.]|nr:DNA-3-methyladenine glycosylase [Edaphocola sp.]
MGDPSAFFISSNPVILTIAGLRARFTVNKNEMDTMNAYPKLPLAFYERADVFQITRELLGKVLVSKSAEGLTSGMIVEAEAYNGEKDKAAHVYGGKRTKRTETMYGEAGHAYIYLCYGIHHMLNVVTNKIDIPKAILIRALEPVDGIELMMRRRKKKTFDNSLTRGPGSLCQALGIHYRQDGTALWGDELWIEDRKITFRPEKISTGPRIGVDYAAEDALLPYRFFISGNPFVSKAPKKTEKSQVTF